MRNPPDKSPDILEKQCGVNPDTHAGEEDCYVHARASEIITA
jgi:hypothetical protein